MPGPPELGRGVIIRPGTPVPAPWDRSPRVLVDRDAVAAARPGAAASPAIETLHRAWACRTPIVVELAVEPSDLRTPEVDDRAPYELEPSFEFPLERFHFLVWANNYDSRDGEPVWWHGRKAARLFGISEGGKQDVLDDQGRGFYVDGGPADPPLLVPQRPTVHRWNAESGSFLTAGHAPPTSELAPDQLAAVTHPSGAAR